MQINTFSFKYFKLFFLILIILLLVSCIGVETTISFNNDGSGKLLIQYRISKLIVNLGSSEEKTPVVPLPVSEDDFKRSIENAQGLSLLSFKQKEDENDIYITAEIGFNKIENFDNMKGFDSMPATLKQKENTFYFSQKIASKPEKIPDKDSIEMINTLFKGYKISFTITAPKKIQSHNLGTLSADGKSLTYSIPVTELLTIKKDTYLTLKW